MNRSGNDLRQATARLRLRIALGLILLVAPIMDHGAHAGGTGPTGGGGSTTTTPLFMPQGAGAEVQFGDFISSNTATTGGGCATATCLQGNGINTSYKYFIEVPSGLPRLRVSIFDADFGAGTTGEQAGQNGIAQRDRVKAGGAYNSSVVYTLKNPAGTTQATQTCTATASTFCADNAWSTLFNTTTLPIANGDWELDVDVSDNAKAGGNGDDINAFGISADEGSGQPEAAQAAVELLVYYLSDTQVGMNPTVTGTEGVPGSKTYTLFPYVTSGCSFQEADFDFDFNNDGTYTGPRPQAVGSIDFTSRTGAFTKNLANSALSINDAWITNSVTGYTSDSDSVDYGLWKMLATIGNYCTSGTNTATCGINGNYANIEIGTSAMPICTETAGNQTCEPAANPATNTMRVYLPTDTLATPVKPYMTQEVRYVFAGGTGGPNPPVPGTATLEQITVQVVNPTLKAITFSPTDLVTVNIPGGGTVYAGSPATSQGGVVAQPAVGGTGNITWNPGTVAAHGTALLTYLVKVTPPGIGSRVPVVGTVASGNGTKGTWVDETGNSTMNFGPLCELAATAGAVSPVVVSEVHAVRDRGGVVLEWSTSSEAGTVAFDVWRWDAREARYNIVNQTPVTALLTAQQGGHYRVLDGTPGARGAGERYVIVEHIATPFVIDRRAYGPFDLLVENASSADRPEMPEAGFDRIAKKLTAPRELAPESENAKIEGSEVDTIKLSGSGTDAIGGTPTLVEIGINKVGMVMVPAQTIADVLGLGLSTVQAMIASHQFQLTNGHSVIAWMPANQWAIEQSGVLFYGQPSTSIYSADNIYVLSQGTGVAMASTTVRSGSNAPGGGFQDTTHVEKDLFAGTVVATNPDSDYWFWANFVAGDPTTGTQSFSLPVANPMTGSWPATLTLNLQGASATGVSDEHHVTVSVNGKNIGSYQWTGVTPATVTLPVTQASLQSGNNTVQLTATLGTGAPYSFWYLQSFDLKYQHLYQTTTNDMVVRADSNASVTVTGFNGSRIRVFDITDPTHPLMAQGPSVAVGPGGAFDVGFSPASPTTPYYAASASGWHSAHIVAGTAPQPLRNPALGADYLILAPSALLSAANELATYRSSQGLKAMVVDVQNIYDVQNGGTPNPHAIHDFLAYTQANWKPAPRYVVLAGLGTFDYRNYLGLNTNLVSPLLVSTPYGLFASDNALADSANTGVPSFAIGRLPVTTNADLHNVVQKIKGYEAAAAGDWSGHAVLVADNSFTADSDALAALVPPLHDVERIYLDQVGEDTARSTLLGDLQSGIGLLNYVGHGGLDRLSSSGLLLATDASNLTNGPLEPMMSALTCTINRFEVPGVATLGGAFVSQPTGGAASVWAATGISITDSAKFLGQQFFLELGTSPNTPQRIGDVIQRAFFDYTRRGGNVSLVALYELLGDPGLVLKTGVVPTPPSLATTRVE
jgi:hypothetical protein